MVKKVGMIGMSEGNGHPYSFSAIINGYDDYNMALAGWPVIHNYLLQKDVSDFGIEGLKVTHIWTPSSEISNSVAKATYIDHVCDSLEEMLESVDAVIIARDDWQSHYEIAKPFLDSGKPVFIDKPLSLNLSELSYFSDFLKNGQLMSCAGLRYARELDHYRQLVKNKVPKFINATIVSEWEKYGIHLLDGIFSGVSASRVVSVQSVGSSVGTKVLKLEGGGQVNLTCLGMAPKTFNFAIYDDDMRHEFEINDNFAAFKRVLMHFRSMVLTGEPPIDPELTLQMMKILIAGNIAQQENREVLIDEITI
jgi:predicted dehydrogenase